jgi:integrase
MRIEKNLDRLSTDSRQRICLSCEGFQFDPSSSLWRLSRTNALNLHWMIDLLDGALLIGAHKTLVFYAQKYSAAHTKQMALKLKAFVSFSSDPGAKLSIISAQMLINYRATLNRRTEHDLGALKGFLKRWMELTSEGVRPEVGSLLRSLRLKGNVKGEAVRLMCPHKGALSNLEFEALQQRLLAAFELREIALEDFVLASLFMATGRRPSQLAALRSADLIEASSSDGLKEFVLNVPRSKQRGGGWRSDFRAVALTPELGTALRQLITENEERFLAEQFHNQHEPLEQLPIFLDWRMVGQSQQERQITILRRGTSQVFHLTRETLGRKLAQLVSRLSIASERINAPIHISPIRLRRTLATRAAREGYGTVVIAELLDHSDDQNARVYTENVPEHVDAINDAVARHLAPLAQAFAGVLVDHEFDAERSGDKTSRVRTQSGSGAGTCGHHGFCGACAPIACYTCRHFQPWLDGAHEEVLEALRSEHARIFALTRDADMAALNDRTIFAVTEVILRCKSRRDELGGLRHLE